MDLIRSFLTEASKAQDAPAFYARVAAILSEWAGAARVRLTRRGKEGVEAAAGPASRSGDPQSFATAEQDGARLEVTLEGAAPGLAIPELTAALMTEPEVDGALVGGASLKAADFIGIVRAGLEAKGRIGAPPR